MSSGKNHIIGFGSGIAANDPGCARGPSVLFAKQPYQSAELLTPILAQDKYQTVAEICTRLSKKTTALYQAGEFFTVIGGDHSSAIGTWSGVAKAMQPEGGEPGLIWIDAHMDAHTPESSASGNIHGMPVAVLLGKGHKDLRSIQGDFPKIKPENLCLIGIRSFEPAELAFLQNMQVKIYFMQDIVERGLEAVLIEAKAQVKKNTRRYGISLDLDGLDPGDVPGVGTPEPGGIRSRAFLNLFKKHFVGDAQWLGFEIAEFNPDRDIDGKTARLIMQLLELL